jgi:hypothetical protein
MHCRRLAVCRNTFVLSVQIHGFITIGRVMREALSGVEACAQALRRYFGFLTQQHTMKLNVNGQTHQLDVELEMPLLWALRDELDIKGRVRLWHRAVRRMHSLARMASPSALVLTTCRQLRGSKWSVSKGLPTKASCMLFSKHG